MPTHFSRSTSPGTSSIAARSFEYVSMIAWRTSRGWRACLIRSTLLRVWSSLRNLIFYKPFGEKYLASGARAADLSVLEVDAALGLVQPGPPARPGVLIVVNRPGLRLAADALVALVQQRVDGDVVRPHVVPHLRLGPVRHGRYLGRPVAFLPGDDLRALPLWGLLPADARHPGVVSGQGLLEGFELPDLAAQVRGAGTHLLAVVLDLLLYSHLGPQDLDGQLVAPHNLFAELGGLLEYKARVDGQNGNLVGDLGDHVQKRHSLAPAERGGKRQALSVGLDRPRYDLPRVGTLQELGLPCQRFQARQNSVVTLGTQGFVQRAILQCNSGIKSRGPDQTHTLHRAPVRRANDIRPVAKPCVPCNSMRRILSAKSPYVNKIPINFIGIK